MKLEINSKDLSRRQIAIGSAAAGLLLGGMIGWFGGREALRQEIKSSISGAFKGAMGGSSPSSDNKPPKKGNYSNITIETDPLTDSKNYFLSISTSEQIPNSIGMAEYGSIIVRCKGNETDVYFNTVNYIGSDYQTASMRWDGGPIEKQQVNPSSGGDALFSRAPKSFIAKASEAKKFVISYKPYSKTDETAVYEFTDQDRKDLKQMQSYCK